MASIVATPLPALGIVKVIVDWTPTYLSDLIHVYRITPDGVQFEVIGSPVRLSGGKAILYDTTAPFDVALSYRVTVNDPVVAFDGYDRTTASGWGTAPMGGAYTVRTGVAGDYSTSVTSTTSVGAISSGTINVPRIIGLGTSYTDVEVEVSVRPPVNEAFGSFILSSVYLRYINSSNFYQFSIGWHLSGVVTARIYRSVAGVLTLITEATIGRYVTGSEYRMIVHTQGPNLRMVGWEGLRPYGWTLQVTDTNHGAGTIGFGATLTTGVTNPLPMVSAFDTMVARQQGTFFLTSSSITLVAGRDGWLRDPLDPARSVRMDNCASHTFACLNASRFVFFQGIDDESYDSATGVFEVIDSENPLTVAQTRKGKSTTLRVVSTTLTDIPDLRALFSPGRDLVVSLPADYGWGIESYGSEAVTVGTVGVSRLNRRDMRKPQRLWQLPVRVVDPDETYPSGATGSNDIPVPGATYGDMKATGLTYGQLKAGTKTYLDWAQGVFT